MVHRLASPPCPQCLNLPWRWHQPHRRFPPKDSLLGGPWNSGHGTARITSATADVQSIRFRVLLRKQGPKCPSSRRRRPLDFSHREDFHAPETVKGSHWFPLRHAHAPCIAFQLGRSMEPDAPFLKHAARERFPQVGLVRAEVLLATCFHRCCCSWNAAFEDINASSNGLNLFVVLGRGCLASP